jgi:hypothetical protein
VTLVTSAGTAPDQRKYGHQPRLTALTGLVLGRRSSRFIGHAANEGLPHRSVQARRASLGQPDHLQPTQYSFLRFAHRSAVYERHGTRLCAHALNPTMHRTSVAKIATLNSASIMAPSTESTLEKLICRGSHIFPVASNASDDHHSLALSPLRIEREPPAHQWQSPTYTLHDLR